MSVCVCVYVCMYACMYVSMYVCIYACMYACMYVCICMHRRYACMSMRNTSASSVRRSRSSVGNIRICTNVYTLPCRNENGQQCDDHIDLGALASCILALVDGKIAVIHVPVRSRDAR